FKAQFRPEPRRCSEGHSTRFGSGRHTSRFETLMRIFLLLCCLIFAAPAHAMPAGAPDEFLRGVYNHYIGEYAHGVPLSNHKQLAKVFTPDLVRLIEADRRQAKGEVPRLDGDPFVDAQDWQISNMRISIENETMAHATATAHFENAGHDTDVTLY